MFACHVTLEVFGGGGGIIPYTCMGWVGKYALSLDSPLYSPIKLWILMQYLPSLSPLCSICLPRANLIYFFVQCFVHVRGRLLTVSGECRELRFPASFSFTAKRLQNHAIRTQQVPDVGFCEILCLWESNCVSINFKEKTRSCELNNATHRGYGYHLEDEADYVYHGANVRVYHKI